MTQNFSTYLRQILTDFQKIYLTVTFRTKFAIKRLLKIPPHLSCFATLPCEIVMSKTSMPCMLGNCLAEILIHQKPTYCDRSKSTVISFINFDSRVSVRDAPYHTDVAYFLTWIRIINLYLLYLKHLMSLYTDNKN